VPDFSGLNWLWPLLAAPFVGSFLGVLIMRLPARAPVALARSACPQCGTQLGAMDLVPLVSFVALRGRCRYCHAPIGFFHLAVELAAAAIALWAVAVDSSPVRIWIDCGLGWTLLTLAWIDWRTFLLPDVLTLPLLLAGLALTMLLDSESLADHCFATVFAYLSFQGLAFAYHRLRGWDGLGGGDAKLVGAAGAWCGLAALPFVVLGSALLGLLAALGLALAGRTVTSTTRIPFGPCIALAFWLVWMYGAWADDLSLLLGRL
jgi:leader peptidase (prepilin peptidase)/N-methyltransferase